MLRNPCLPFRVSTRQGLQRRHPVATGRVGSALILASLCAVLLGGVGTPVEAQLRREATPIFVCRDASGRTISGDRPSPDCANQPLRELNPFGVTTREIPAPLTPEQLRRKAIADEAARIDGIKQRQADARDRALLLSYADIDALELARDRQLTEIQHEITVAEGRMIASHKDLEAAKAQMEALSAQPARDAVRRNVRLISQSILADNEAIKRMRAELVEVDQRFDADRLRLRQLLREPEPTLRPVGNPTAAPRR